MSNIETYNQDVIYTLGLLVKSPDRAVSKGWYTSSKTRKTIMINEQNTIIRKGRVMEIKWENMGSGVYRVYLDL